MGDSGSPQPAQQFGLTVAQHQFEKAGKADGTILEMRSPSGVHEKSLRMIGVAWSNSRNAVSNLSSCKESRNDRLRLLFEFGDNL